MPTPSPPQPQSQPRQPPQPQSQPQPQLQHPAQSESQPQPPPRATIHIRGVRRRALRRLTIGAVLAAVWIAIVLFAFRGRSYSVWGPALGIPAVPLLHALVELITGRSLFELAQTWDDLRPWQRGVFGLLVVALEIVVISCVAVLIVTALV